MKEDKKKERAIKILSVLKKKYPSAKYYLNFNNALELLVAAILSAQCRDETVNAVTPELFRRFKTAKDYAEADESVFFELIKKIPFYRNKGKNIQKACKIIDEKYGGKVPSSMDELTALPGIARKTANVILSNAFNIVEGIPVDTHVIRLAQRLGLVKSSNPVVIEKELMSLFPKKDWKNLPYILKTHGRQFCTAKNPKCEQCFLKKLCPSYPLNK